MSIKSDVTTIYNNRFLRSEKEVHDFETALTRVVCHDDVNTISALCSCFHDETEDHEVMFGLIHGVESLYKNHVNEGILLIARSVSSVIDFANDWMEIIHYRVLNDMQTRNAYRTALSQLSENERTVVLNLLLSIKKEDPDLFGSSVDSIITH